MNQIVRYGKFAFIGFIVGYILTFVFGTWIWLDMRVNIALIIPIATILGLLISAWNKCLNSRLWLSLPEITVSILFLVLYWGNLDAITVIPGILFREAFYISFISLKLANLLLLAVIIIGNFVWLINTNCEIVEPKKDLSVD